MFRKTYSFYLIGILFLAIAAVLTYIAALSFSTPSPTSALPQDRGIILLDPPQALDNFTLVNQYADAWSLSSLDTPFLILAFGFTHCPDVCPLTLQEMQRMRSDLDDLSQQVTFALISVDGQRDTPDVLNEYFSIMRVDDFVIGLTGSTDAARAIASAFGVDFVFSTPDDNGDYTIEHTAGFFVVDEKANWIRRYRYGADHAAVMDDLRTLLSR